MGKKKIFNDPIYGIINYPYEILYDLIDHPYYQRLRRISQMGLSHYVYPGAIHTRFHHGLGALHLMTRAIETLRWKNVEITEEEGEAVSIAILLHDIGHGPFSHALERILIPYDHEKISLAYMENLNHTFGGKLSLAIKIFKGKYHKKFLHQLVTSQLDMDRLDYLIRDSYFTGVAEGVIGYDRIIKMLNVCEDQLVVEEKGIYSVEKFLMARRLMYWQVYLHKTSIASEQMLILFVNKYIEAIKNGTSFPFQQRLNGFLQKRDVLPLTELIDIHSTLDDIDIMILLKNCVNTNNYLLKFISKSLLERSIFLVNLQRKEFSSDKIKEVQKLLETKGFTKNQFSDLIILGKESNLEYSILRNEIKIISKDGKIKPFSEISDYPVNAKKKELNFMCYPRV